MWRSEASRRFYRRGRCGMSLRVKLLEQEIAALKRERAELVGIIRIFLWVHKTAHNDKEDGNVSPLKAYVGRVRYEYINAFYRAQKWKR
jgi:hypothetical protein